MFKIHSIDGGRPHSTEYISTSKASVQAGTLMTLKNGDLESSEGEDVPEYLCLKSGKVENGMIPVTRINHDMILETKNNGNYLTLGQKVGIRLGIDLALETEGAAQVVYFDESIVRIRI